MSYSNCLVVSGWWYWCRCQLAVFGRVTLKFETFDLSSNQTWWKCLQFGEFPIEQCLELTRGFPPCYPFVQPAAGFCWSFLLALAPAAGPEKHGCTIHFERDVRCPKVQFMSCELSEKNLKSRKFLEPCDQHVLFCGSIVMHFGPWCFSSKTTLGHKV